MSPSLRDVLGSLRVMAVQIAIRGEMLKQKRLPIRARSTTPPMRMLPIMIIAALLWGSQSRTLSRAVDDSSTSAGSAGSAGTR